MKIRLTIGLFWIGLMVMLNASEIKIIFAGDIMAHDVNIAQKDPRQIYRFIEGHLRQADMSFANFENVIIPNVPQQAYPRFNVHPPYAQAAIEAGFSHFSVANNHSGDHGRAGVIASKQSWQALSQIYPHIRYNGFKEAHEVLSCDIFVIQGLKVGFVALTQFINWAELGNDIGQDNLNIINHSQSQQVQKALEALAHIRTQVDLLIVAYHGGAEYVRAIEPYKQRFFKAMIDTGVDIVWGAHPHVLQPWEYYKDRVIMHSAGNLISGQTWRLGALDFATEQAHRGDTLLYQVVVTTDKKGNITNVRMDKTIPLANFKHPQHGPILLDLNVLDTYEFLTPEWRHFYEQRLLQIEPMRHNAGR
jgi:poly-gamma-glutamate capsule biosynthesis protein CapA/YwtB (metallophosphatase superfamily)